MPTNVVAWMLALYLLAYGLLGGVVMRRRWTTLPPLRDSDPAAWYTYWLRKVIPYEIWLGVGILTWLATMFVLIPRVFTDPFTVLGFGLGVGAFIVSSLVFDIWLLTRARRVSRKNTSTDAASAD